MDVPKSSGTHCVEQIRHSTSLQESHNRSLKNHDAPHWVPNVTQGVLGTIKSLVHDLGAGFSMTEPTINNFMTFY